MFWDGLFTQCIFVCARLATGKRYAFAGRNGEGPPRELDADVHVGAISLTLIHFPPGVSFKIGHVTSTRSQLEGLNARRASHSERLLPLKSEVQKASDVKSTKPLYQTHKVLSISKMQSVLSISPWTAGQWPAQKSALTPQVQHPSSFKLTSLSSFLQSLEQPQKEFQKMRTASSLLEPQKQQ